MKKVLVLMSTYNGENYVSQMIDSVLLQKDVDINILIRDDGSNDKTLQIIEDYCNDNNKIMLIKGKNKGSTKSFLDLIMDCPSSYDFYALCDQDDYWLENKIIRAVEKLENFDDNKPSLYYSGQIITDQNLIKIGIHKLNTKRSMKANYIFNNMAGCTSVFNKTLLNKIKEYYPEGIKEHDNWIYKLCVSLGGNVYADSNQYILYRQHGNNVVGLNTGMKGKINRAIQQINNTNPSCYAEIIINAYSIDLDEEWLCFLNKIVKSKKNYFTKLMLCF